MIEEISEIVFNEELNEGCYLMGLQSTGITMEAKPGQFVMIQVGPGPDPLLRRPFSICGCRKEDGIFLILYKVIGRGTRIISKVGKGDCLSVIGPLGRGFIFPEGLAKPLLVSGGMGIAPLLFLSDTLKSDETLLMAGYQSGSQIVDIQKINHSHLKVLTAAEDGQADHHGLVTELLEDRLHESSDERIEIFACGPIPMLRKVASMTLDMEGIGCQVSLESPMACGVGACQGCAVKASSSNSDTYYSVCKDGPVFEARDLDWENL